MAAIGSDRRRQLVSLVCLLMAGALVGVLTNLAKLAETAGVSPFALLAWSVLGAALAHGVVAVWRRGWPSLDRRMVEYSVIAGLVTLVVPYLINFAAVPKVGASFVALSIAFPPLYTYVGALFLKMERFRIDRALGVVLALAGAAWLAVFKLTEPGAETFWIVATLAVPVVLAIGNIYRTLRWPAHAEPADLAPGMLAASAVFLFAASALPSLSLAVPIDRATPVLLIFAQAVTFSIMYVFFFILQQTAGPVYLSLLGSVAAVVGAAIAILLLGESPPRGLTVGAGLIAIGIALLTRQGGALPRR